MQRLPLTPRARWRGRADELGFPHHTVNGQPYWDESACYRFTLRQIEDDLEAATAELWALCREFVTRAVRDERAFARMQIPPHAWDLVAQSWARGDASLYGRFDLAYDGRSAPVTCRPAGALAFSRVSSPWRLRRAGAGAV